MEWLELILRLRRWTDNGTRDPHKALLVLYAIGQLQRVGYKTIRFRDAESVLEGMLKEFGPPRPAGAGYPFHHLASDGLWEVATASGGPCPSAERAALLAEDVHGRLHPAFARDLLAEPALLAQIVRLLLDLNFEGGLHADVCAAAGLMPELAHTAAVADFGKGDLPRTDRDPILRQKILLAYDCRCAFCGFEGWIGTTVIGLEAARLRWWAFEGLDDPTNCLCLCTLHHKLLDKGVLGLSPLGKIMVSRQFVGTTETSRRLVTDLSGRAFHPPQPGFAGPEARNIAWHGRQVFRGPSLA
ncbi:phosphorothioated DNA-binding restriction endonuclease [Actinocorallia sp. A-T 12471]|uniref:phosphorothioated DNA-binding restriction endonuclease n=1 Tax=Actinocorallia sp. A-T 12471 TaxID=3089813 RepID=UPI0029CB5FC9|nr:HNH endonuclease [Actinocorallia sp. A-T 12471]MDX6739401.1 HNH endonuclease [Actinocorallia sp. A-T 12471]